MDNYHSDDQKSKLVEASNNVKKNAYYLRRAMDDDNLKDALRYAVALLGELRTSLLSPKRYYELSIQVTAYLTELELFFRSEQAKGRSLRDLYGLVQHAGNVLPRLYLLCTVGACCIRAHGAPARVVLKDLVEMCRGIQHPTRGLFLRAYLVQICRDLLPDTEDGTAYERPEDGSVDDSIDFLLLNFTEMNKLWVRMKLQGVESTRHSAKIEEERAQLSDLVGKNVTRLSQLEGLTFDTYRDKVLPSVLEQIVHCKDELAQQYLMQCLIMGFPDDFHLGTLATLMAMLPKLQPGVKLHTVMASLLDRLALFAKSGGKEARDQLLASKAFETAMEAASSSLLRNESDAGEAPSPSVVLHPVATDVIPLFGALISFASAVYPDTIHHVDNVLSMMRRILHETLRHAVPPLLEDERDQRALVAVLSAPLLGKRYAPVVFLQLDHFMPLVKEFLSVERQREVSRIVGNALLSQRTRLTHPEDVRRLFQAVAPLMSGRASCDEGTDPFVEEDGSMLAKLVHCIRNTQDDDFEALKAAGEALLCAEEPLVALALPALCFSVIDCIKSIMLVVSSSSAPCFESMVEKWFAFLSEMACECAEMGESGVAYQVLLEAARVGAEAARSSTAAEKERDSADSGHDVVHEQSMDMMERACVLYEERIGDCRGRVRALLPTCGMLHASRGFLPEARDVLTSKIKAYAGGLVRKRDQIDVLLALAHVYWQEGPGGVRDGEAVVGCLERAQRVAEWADKQRQRMKRPADEVASLRFAIVQSYTYFREQAGVESIDKESMERAVEKARESAKQAQEEGCSRWMTTLEKMNT